MKNILKIVDLNYMLMKPYERNYMLLIIIYVIGFTIGYKSLSFSTVIVAMYSVMTLSSLFSIDEKNGLNRLYGALPINKIDIIKGRYVYIILKGIIITSLALILSVVLLLLMKVSINVEEIIFTLVLSIFIFSLFTSVQMPIYAKKGFEKGKALTYIPFLLIFILSIVVGIVLNNSEVTAIMATINISAIFNEITLIIILILLSIIFVSVSYIISKKIYINKELD